MGYDGTFGSLNLDIEITHCWEAYDGGRNRPLWNATTYEFLREKYVENVDKYQQLLDLEEQESGGLSFPFETRYVPGKGRGIFATSDLPKGTLMWDEYDHAMFHHLDDWDEFLHEIGYDLACDVIQWAYVEPCRKKKRYDQRRLE
mmetsp:Transcript_7988/g.9137  ORF Transcript_7988/g.9137 Transcript_7988/m.9137 type:complete len:145 (+) Transcript_7988:83-517(+)